MTFRPLSTHLTLSIALALAAQGGVSHAQSARGGAADLSQLLAAPRFDRAAAERLYARAVLDDGVAALENTLAARMAAGAPTQRAMAALVRANVAWQSGDADAAMTATDRALALAPGPDAWLFKARLLDAAGEEAQARGWYEKAAAATGDAGERAAIRRRLTLIDARATPATLAAALRGAGAEERRNGAIVLALLGDRAAALALHPAAASYADQVRLADWAIAARDTAGARDHAWQAFTLATEPRDRRYALALLVEGYRVGGDLAGALAVLAAKPQGAEVAQAQVDLLLELGRYDAAIAAVTASADPAMRQRLLGILDLAGRSREGTAEYRRLIAAEPHRSEGYTALAALYLGQGDSARALEVYRELFARNPGDAELLAAAARQMIAMGLGDQAMALMAQAARAPAMAVPYRFFLIEADRAAGREAAALERLAELRRILPPASAQRIAVADTYEAMGRKEQAFDVLRALEAADPALDYDQRVHIAMLASQVGQETEALARWQRLWAAETLPARKTYLARQIVRTVQATDAVATLASGLDRRLTAGTLDRAGIGLLVEMRIAQNDRAAAIAAIERYGATSGQAQAATLRQMVETYARLDDRARADAALRRLVSADPANADLYLRQLTLNAVRFPVSGETPAARVARIDALLAELRRATALPPAEAAQFTGSVYGSAGFDDRAVAAYRRALALDPGNADAQGQLAQLLRKLGRQREAAAMLQYRADTATDGGDLALAIETLMAALAPDPMGAPSPAGIPRLATVARRWAERLVLERIAQAGADRRSYALLADLAQADGDRALQLRTYEEALPLAGEQRPAMLRQIVAAAAAPADAPVKLAFGRRLIALRYDYPPDVYADLARAMLAAGDLPGAERAFAMMAGIDGLTDVDQVKGAAYAQQGYVDQALLYDERALLRARDDTDLVIRTAILRERRGDAAIAFRWYWPTLLDLLRRQPAQVGAGDATLDLKQFYATLVEGALLSWPGDPAAASASQAELDALLARAVAAAVSGTPLTDHAQLASTLDLAYRLAAFRGDAARFDAIERTLAPGFGADPAYRRTAQGWRDRMGLASASAGDEASWATAALARQAQDDGNDDLSVAIALTGGDDAAIRATMDEAMAVEARGGDAAPSREASPLFTLVARAADLLPPARLRTLILARLDGKPFRDTLLFDIYRSGGDQYARLQAAAGVALFDEARLMTLLVERGNTPLPAMRNQGASREDGSATPAALVRRFSTEQRLALYERLVARILQSGQESGFQDPLVAQLLAANLAPAQQARLSTALMQDLGYQRRMRVPTGAFVIQRLMVLDAAPANRPVLLRAARLVADRYPDARQLPAFLDAFYAGDKVAAYRAIHALQADVSAGYPGMDFVTPVVTAHLADVQAREVEAFMARDTAPPAEVAAFYRDHVLPDEAAGKDVRARYAKLAALDPANLTYRAGLLRSLWRAGDTAGFVAQLRPWVAAHPADREAAAVLALAAGGGGPLDPDRLAALADRAAAPSAGNDADFVQLFGLVYEAWKAKDPTAAIVLETEKRRQVAAPQQAVAPTAPVDPVRSLRDAATRARATVRSVARGLWRATAPRADADDGGAGGRLALIAALPDPDAPEADQPLLDALETPAMTDELEVWLTASPPDARARARRLYALVAAGLMRQDRSAARIEAGWRAVEEATITPHGLQMLTTLVDRGGVAPTAPRLAALARRLAAMPVLSAAQRVQLARLFARDGDADTAGALLRAAVLQMIYPTPADAAATDEAAALAGTIVADLRDWRDRAAAVRVHAQLVAIIHAELGADTKEPPFADFPALAPAG